jgi:hypothetical protein
MKNLATGLITAAALAICACASGRGRATTAVTASSATPADSAPPPIVQVRDFSHSALVDVIAWSPDESEYGLRSSLLRDGTLVHGEHELFVSTYYESVRISPYLNASYSRSNGRRNTVMTTAPEAHLLLSAGVRRDPQACIEWPICSPLTIQAVRVPDELLRANRDSFAVRFYGRANSALIVSVYRDLIDAYLRKVDSVSAALRKH